MGFKVGEKRHPNAGRKAGTPNKDTLPLKAILEANKCEPVLELLKLIPDLIPEKQADVYLKLLEYIYPRRKAIETTVDPSLIDAIKNMEGKSNEELLAILHQNKLP